VEHKRPAGAYPLRDFHKICRICAPFQDALVVKISLDLLKRLRSYAGFKLTVSGCPHILAPPSGEIMRHTPKVFDMQDLTRGPLSPSQVWWGSDFTRRRGGQNVDFFVCPSRF